jgi:hypothetical protein
MTLSKPSIGYDVDFNLWLEQTVNLLNLGRFDEVDLDSLVEELESMNLEMFPATCPFAVEEILDEEFFPEHQ